VEYVTEDGLLSIDLALRPPPAAKHRQAAALLAQAPTVGGSGAGRRADARCTFQGSEVRLVLFLCQLPDARDYPLLSSAHARS